MTKPTLPVLALGVGLALGAAGPLSPATAQQEQQQPIYGSQLMTEQERAEYRARMRAATSAEEREQIRLEHHQMMQERAEQRGVTLPDEPPAAGMGSGMKQGQGMQGRGMPRQGMQGQGMPGQGMQGQGMGGMEQPGARGRRSN